MIRFIRWLVPRLRAPRVIWDRNGASPYLSRYYLTARPTMASGSEPFKADGTPKLEVMWKRPWVSFYLHRFHRGDDDHALHNHPWHWALSLVLWGGYYEERRMPDGTVQSRTVRPGSLNWIRHDSFHRVDLIRGECWSLFIAGPKTSSWGFWDRDTGEFLPWRDFIAKVRGADWDGAKP